MKIYLVMFEQNGHDYEAGEFPTLAEAGRYMAEAPGNPYQPPAQVFFILERDVVPDAPVSTEYPLPVVTQKRTGT